LFEQQSLDQMTSLGGCRILFRKIDDCLTSFLSVLSIRYIPDR